MRGPWHSAEDGALFLAEYPALKLRVSDLGTDLVGAANDRGLPHQAHLMHERMWWTEHVFAPLSRRELRRAQDVLACWDGATRVAGPGRRLSAARVAAAEVRRTDAEADVFTAVRAEVSSHALGRGLSDN